MNKSFHAALRTTFLSAILILGLSIIFVAMPNLDSAQAVSRSVEKSTAKEGRALTVQQVSALNQFEKSDTSTAPDQAIVNDLSIQANRLPIPEKRNGRPAATQPDSARIVHTMDSVDTTNTESIV